MKKSGSGRKGPEVLPKANTVEKGMGSGASVSLEGRGGQEGVHDGQGKMV